MFLLYPAEDETLRGDAVQKSSPKEQVQFKLTLKRLTSFCCCDHRADGGRRRDDLWRAFSRANHHGHGRAISGAADPDQQRLDDDDPNQKNS